ncbi:MAG: alpha/beta hydrolase, partial [Burkholderiales bacterium]
SAPVDLAASGSALDRGVNRRTYTRVFLTTLKAKAFAKRALNQLPVDERRLARVRTLHEYDDIVTAPLHGFRDADDYWARASSAPWLAGVRVPTLLLNARNDPFLPAPALERAARKASDALVLEFPAVGGHAGFLSAPFPGRHDWMPRRVLDFLARA